MTPFTQAMSIAAVFLVIAIIGFGAGYREQTPAQYWLMATGLIAAGNCVYMLMLAAIQW